MAGNTRIEDLRRRIQKDPASIAFAQLAEEHRRGHQYEDAIRVCRAGLAQHPAYLSARITLGRALLEVGRLDEAATEFEYVLKAAPDNLTAIRELADIHQRRRVSESQFRSAEPEASANAEGAGEAGSAYAEGSGETSSAYAEGSGETSSLSELFEPEPDPKPAYAGGSGAAGPAYAGGSGAASSELDLVQEPPTTNHQLAQVPDPVPDPVLVELEAWLSVLAADRVTRPSHI